MMTEPTIRALIFDFDGLILDTEGPEYRSWSEIYQSYGCELDFAVWATCIGTANVFDPYAELERLLGRPIDREEIRAARRIRNDELLGAETVRSGIAEYLEAARELGIACAVASSSSRSWVAGHLARLGLLDAFACLRCADDVPEVKPNPALYQAAIGALRVKPTEAIALEDSPNGVLAAKRAGLTCVAIPNAVTRQLPLDHADLIIDSLLDLPLGQLLGWLGQRRIQGGG